MTDLELARECGAETGELDGLLVWVKFHSSDAFATFTQRIRQEEREATVSVCEGVLDMKEEARAFNASQEARGTPEELDRLRHWSTVSTFNAGIRRCIAAIRSRAQEGQSNG